MSSEEKSDHNSTVFILMLIAIIVFGGIIFWRIQVMNATFPLFVNFCKYT